MFAANTNIQSVINEFRIDSMMRYSQFVPRLYNLCKSLGYTAGHIMPSRAFCSDENQGYPIILIAKHFGTFPFNHGMVGGIVASDRHGAHAHHGKDLVIIQASHVGYDPDSKTFGTYRRINTTDDDASVTCGKVGAVIDWYQEEYRFAQNNIYLGREGDDYLVMTTSCCTRIASRGCFSTWTDWSGMITAVRCRCVCRVRRISTRHPRNSGSHCLLMHGHSTTG